MDRDEEVDEHRLSREHGTLDGLFRVYVVGAVFMLAVAVVEIVQRHVMPYLVVEAITTTATTVLLSKRFSSRTRALAVVTGTSIISCMALLQFGPMIGTGVFFAVAASGGTFFFGLRGALASAACVVVAMAGAAIGTRAGWLPTTWPSPPVVAWVRMSVSTVVGIAGLAALMLREQLVSRRSVELHVEALRRERMAEADRARLLEAGLASQRLESLGRLAGGVAHDFNNALTVIRSGVDLLRTTEDATERAEILADVERATRGAAATAKQLVAFSRRVPDSAETCDPCDVVTTFGASMSRVLPESLRVVVDATPARRVPIGRALLEQTLLNLVLNARDAMPTGGTITLRVREDDAHVVLEVKDEGAGMDDAVRARVFEPFFSTKADGTGLGLAVVWGVATRAGGTVDVTSAPGEGACFRLRLPATQATSAARDEHSTSRPPAPPARVLLLEDHDEVRRSMERALRQVGHRVTSAANAADATTELRAATFDILVTDGIVPGGGVPELVARFRDQHPSAPVLLCSGHLPDTVVPLGTDAHVAFLAKPFEIAELQRAVADLLDAPG